MKRNEFIKSLGLSSIALGLLPSVVFGKDESTKLVEIPAIKEHVRHGQFRLDQTTEKSLSKSIERHVFYKDGHSKSLEDMYVTKLNLDNHPLLINRIKNSIDLKYKDKSYRLKLEEKTKIALDSGVVLEFKILTPISEHSINNLKSISHLIPLSGNYSYEGTELKSKIIISNLPKINLKSDEESCLLIIHT